MRFWSIRKGAGTIRLHDVQTRLLALGLSEDDALALIERADDARWSMVSARDPALTAWLGAAALDRAAVQGLPEPEPGPRLRAGAVRVLAEAGVGAGGVVEPPLTLGDLRVVARTRAAPALRWSMMLRIGGGLGAIAACVAVAVIAPAWWSGWSSPRTPRNEVVALDPMGAVAIEADGAADAALVRGSPEASGAEAATALASAAPSEPEWFVDADRAAALAWEGRVAIRVRTADAARTLERLAALSGDRGLRSPAWRLSGSVGAEAEAAVRVALGPVERPRVMDPAVLASDAADGVRSVFEAPPARAEERPVLLADARAEASALASLLAALSQDGRQRAVFEALPTAHGLAPPTDASVVLWWTEPAERWGQARVWVPVVIEAVERR